MGWSALGNAGNRSLIGLREVPAPVGKRVALVRQRCVIHARHFHIVRNLFDACAAPDHRRVIEPAQSGFRNDALLFVPSVLVTTNRNPTVIAPSTPVRKTVVVVGNGMVGHRFCERLAEFDVAGEYRIVTFCEEPRAAYDRVQLSKYFTTRDPESLRIADPAWYREQGIDLHIGDRVVEIDRMRRIARSARGLEIAYDVLVLATGSTPFVPAIPGVDLPGVFVYRTIEDLDRTMAYAEGKKRRRSSVGGCSGWRRRRRCSIWVCKPTSWNSLPV